MNSITPKNSIRTPASEVPPIMSSDSKQKIAVIGAGITGATTAYALMERGYTVTLIERERFAGMVTSFANGGQLSASNAEVWNSLGTIKKGLTMMLQKDAPLSVNPSPSLHKYSWFARFMAEVPNHDSNTVETTRLALAAREHLLRMAEAEKIDFDCVKRGILHFYSSKKDFEAAKVGHDLMLEAGIKRHHVTPAEITDIEPTLKGDFYAGYYTPDDFTGDIHKYTRGLVDALERKGVTTRFNTEVTNIQESNGTITITTREAHTNDAGKGATDSLSFDKVIICAGVHSKQMSEIVGDKINIYPVKGYSITVNVADEHADLIPWVSLLDEKAKIVTSRLGANRFRVAGTAEFNGYNTDIRADRIAPLTAWVEKFFPQVPTDKIVPWAGLRPMTPNMMPRVGAGKMPGTYFNTGHGHLGWTLSAITSQMIADHLQGTNA